MKRCPDCDYPNPDNFTNCFKCHTSLELEPPSPQVQPPADEPMHEAEPVIADSQPDNTCPECGLTPESDEYSMPLCAACRTKMAYRPYPVWIISCSVVIAVILAFAMIKFPSALSAGIAYERGQRAEQVRNYEIAANHYYIATKHYPDSTMALARLFICQCKSDDYDGAAVTSAKLDGREVSADLMKELDRAATIAAFKIRNMRSGGR